VTWTKVAPRGWRLLGREWGFQWGRIVVVDLETLALESYQKTLRELSMRQALEFCQAWFQRQGWGNLVPDFSPAHAGAFVLRLEHSAFAEAIGPVGTRCCTMLEGFFAALFSHLAHKLLCVREVQCVCSGHETCTFLVVTEGRVEQLETALEADGNLSRVIATLAANARGAP